MPGLTIEVSSDVPVGAGLSSSAALECAVAGAVVDASGAGELDPITLATVARRAENDFVGVPTGPMDQLASVLGEAGAAVLIDCRDLSARTVPLDVQASGLELLVINTMADHELVGGEYAERRRQCDQARDLLGLASMRDATQADLDRIDDPLIRRRAQHVVTEIARVEDVVGILDAGRVGGHRRVPDRLAPVAARRLRGVVRGARRGCRRGAGGGSPGRPDDRWRLRRLRDRADPP